MYKIQDVKLVRSLLERMCGLSTIVCYTGDVTDQTLTITHVKNGEAIRDFINEQSENQRVKKRTLHTMDIDADSVDGE